MGSVFPQGRQAAWVVMIAIPTLCLMAAGMGGCNYVRVNDDQLGFGLIWREETIIEDELTSRRIKCTAFDDLDKDRFDEIWKLGMAFAYIAIIFVSISSVAALTLSCATYSQFWKHVLSACFVVGAMCQVLTFVVLGSDICEESEDCTLSFGAGITIGGIACSLLAAAATNMLIPPSHVRKAAIDRPVVASHGEEDRDDEHADDSVTEDDTNGAAATDLEAGFDRDTLDDVEEEDDMNGVAASDPEVGFDHGTPDDVEEEEGLFVPEDVIGDEKEETPDLNLFAAEEDEERIPFAVVDYGYDDDKPVIDSDDEFFDTDEENLSDVRLTEEDIEAIIDEGRDESGVEYDKAEEFGKKKLTEI
jgi:hypothetical protein